MAWEYPYKCDELMYVLPYCLSAHDDEVLDVTFDYTGQRLATASTDGRYSLNAATVVLVYCA